MGRRWSAIRIDGPDFFTANDAYVIGRDVSPRVLRSAARTVRWTSISTAPRLRVRSYRLRATSGLAFQAQPRPATATLSGPGTAFILVGQERENAPALRIARFWHAAEPRPRCPGYQPTVQRTVIRGDTVVRLLSDNTAAARDLMRAVTLRTTARADYCSAAPPDGSFEEHPLCPDA